MLQTGSLVTLSCVVFMVRWGCSFHSLSLTILGDISWFCSCSGFFMLLPQLLKLGFAYQLAASLWLFVRASRMCWCLEANDSQSSCREWALMILKLKHFIYTYLIFLWLVVINVYCIKIKQNSYSLLQAYNILDYSQRAQISLMLTIDLCNSHKGVSFIIG